MPLFAEKSGNKGFSYSKMDSWEGKFEDNNVIDIDMAVFPLILGENDVKLRYLESHFQPKLTVRNNNIYIHDDGVEGRKVKRVFMDIIALHREINDVKSEDIDTILRLGGFKKGDRRGADKLETTVVDVQKRNVKTRGANQNQYVKLIEKRSIVFSTGPAGTGKTYLAVAMAVNLFQRKCVEKIILVRPVVESGETLGFLPGDIMEKVDPYFRPLYDALGEMLSSERVRKYIEKGQIEVAPLAYMRGRTLNNAFVILDEAQNTTHGQMKMFLTRLGQGSKAVLTGDLTQIDLPQSNNSGLSEAWELLQGVEDIGFVKFDEGDVVRHKLVADILRAYDRKK